MFKFICVGKRKISNKSYSDIDMVKNNNVNIDYIMCAWHNIYVDCLYRRN